MKKKSLQFGELENVYCPTGKGYAFMTFKYASGIDAVQRARFVIAFQIYCVYFQNLKHIIPSTKHQPGLTKWTTGLLTQSDPLPRSLLASQTWTAGLSDSDSDSDSDSAIFTHNLTHSGARSCMCAARAATAKKLAVTLASLTMLV